MESEYYYRIDDRRCSLGVDEWGGPLGGRVIELSLHKMPVLRRTPKGVWLDNYGGERFVLNGANKRFACPTVEEAQESFKARKEKQIRLLREQIRDAEEALDKCSRRRF
jgi:hypothetical protein